MIRILRQYLSVTSPLPTLPTPTILLGGLGGSGLSPEGTTMWHYYPSREKTLTSKQEKKH